mgnify:CR=1 FL=1
MRASLPATLLLSALLSGCASLARQEDCCGAPKEVVYVDKPVAECTRSLRDVTQVSPCQVCSRFQVAVRADSSCAR